MKTGLLWFDDDPRRQLEDKVLRAAAHYERKYGQVPNLCFVHPSVFNGNGKGKKSRVIIAKKIKLLMEPSRLCGKGNYSPCRLMASPRPFQGPHKPIRGA